MSHNNIHRTRGFTLVEMLIVAPIVILVIGTFISLVVNMTGEVLASRASNVLSYNIQDSLTRIEQDVKQSGSYLATNNVALVAPQGFNGSASNTGDTTNFHNVDPTNGNMLILNMYATTQNPVTTTTNQSIYANMQPNACNSSSVTQNTLLYYNVIYFVQNNTLWRRVVMPQNYQTVANGGVACATPWQQPSCAVGYNASVSSFCQTNDIDLVDGVSTSGFNVSYYPSSSSTTADSAATATSSSDAVRQTALLSDNTVGVTISAGQTVGGRSIAQSGSLRVTGLDYDTTATSVSSAPIVSAQPSSSTVQVGATINFNTGANPANGTSVQWQQSTDGGTTFNNIYDGNGVTGSNGLTLNFASVTLSMNGYQFRAIVSNGSGSSTSNPATLTVTTASNLPWTPISLQNGWNNYSPTVNATSYVQAGYTKSADGIVSLKGVINRIGTAINGEVIGTLPLGYRPDYTMSFLNESDNYGGGVTINSAGQILFNGGDSTYLSLDNVHFLTTSTQVPHTWNTLSPGNSWTNSGAAGYPTLSYANDTYGRAFIRGALTQGTTTDGTVITSLPAALQDPYYQIFAIESGTTWNEAGLTTSTNLVAKGNLNSGTYYPTLMYYPSGYNSFAFNNLTLSNGWTNYGGSYAPAQYTYNSADSIVSLRGIIKSGTTTAGTVITTLPSGQRPTSRIIYPSACNGATCRIDIMPDGTVIANVGVSATSTSLDGISFIAGE